MGEVKLPIGGLDVETQPIQRLKSLEQVEREHILLVLSSVGGRVLKAADILKVTAKTIYNKLEQWDVSPRDLRDRYDDIGI